MALQKILITAFLTVTLTSAWAVAPIVDLNEGSNNSDNMNSGTTYPVSSDSLSTTSSETFSSQPTIDPVASRQSLPLDQRVKLLEQQLSNLAQMNLPGKIDALEQKVQQLNGQLEEQAHTIEQLTNQQKNSAAMLGQSVKVSSQAVTARDDITSTPAPVKSLPKLTPKQATQATESGDVPDAAGDGGATTTPVDNIVAAESSVVQNTAPPESATATSINSPASEEKAYQAAFNLLVTKQNKAAITAFETFLKNYPNGSYAANAHYWLGESYNTMGKTGSASKEFATVIQKYPTDSKVPDALLKIAIIHDDAGQHDKATKEFQAIIKQYPDTTAARLAKMRLKAAST